MVVFNLPDSVQASDVSVMLEDVGDIEDIELQRMPSGESKGFAYVYFENRESVRKAIKMLDGH